MEKLRNTLNKVLNLLAGLSMTVMVVLTTYQVIVRYIFNSPSTWSEELVGYLFGWSTMLGATIVSGERGHMNIPVLVDRFNPTMRKAFHIFAEVIAFIFSAAILVFGGFQVSKLAMGQQTSSLGVAVGVFYWVMPVCGVIILIYSILNIIGIANGSISLDTPEDADFARWKLKWLPKLIKITRRTKLWQFKHYSLFWQSCWCCCSSVCLSRTPLRFLLLPLSSRPLI